MAKTRKLAVVNKPAPAPAPRSTAEQIDGYVEAFGWQADAAQRRAAKGAAEFAEEAVLTPSKFLAQARWIENAVARAVEATLYERVLLGAANAKEEGTFASKPKREAWELWQGMDWVLEENTRSLMHDEWRGGSTSGFANAVEQVTRAQASQFVRSNRGMVDKLLKLLEQLDAEVAAATPAAASA